MCRWDLFSGGRRRRARLSAVRFKNAYAGGAATLDDRAPSLLRGDVNHRRPLADPLLRAHRPVGDDIAAGRAVFVVDRLQLRVHVGRAVYGATMMGPPGSYFPKRGPGVALPVGLNGPARPALEDTPPGRHRRRLLALESPQPNERTT
jgi:hypothetical protein